MLVAFEALPDTARVWIYQANRLMAATEEEQVATRAGRFCEQWAAHNTPLRSSFKILHNKFLILAVDESYNQASGCSIDTSVRFIQELEQQLGINFFDRTQVAFLINDHVYTTNLTSIKDEISTGKIDQKTLTFNLQAQNISEFENQWLIPAADSWMKRYFNA